MDELSSIRHDACCGSAKTSCSGVIRGIDISDRNHTVLQADLEAVSMELEACPVGFVGRHGWQTKPLRRGTEHPRTRCADVHLSGYVTIHTKSRENGADISGT